MLKNFLAATLLLFAACFSAAVAQDIPKVNFIVPDQKIVGGDEPVALGEIVDLSVTPIKLTPTYLTSTSYTWMILDGGKKKKVRESADGIWFAAGLKDQTLWAHCAITHLYVVKDKDGKVVQLATRTVILLQKVTIGSPNPNPNPNPGPGPGPAPGPDPVFPDGQYKLSALTYKTAVGKVSDADARTKGAVALAKGYEGVASAIAAGTITDLTKALNETKTANNKALDDAKVDASKWEAFSLDLQEAVYGLYKDKKINSAADLGMAWIEVAAGLKKVK